MSAASAIQATSTSQPTSTAAPRRNMLQLRHRLWLTLAALAGAALVTVVAVNGMHYYMLPLAQRVRSPQHVLLRPSGTIGRGLGIVGLSMFAIMFLYPLRKRLAFLSGWGTTKNWLDYHIVLGITAPVLITFHASFKLTNGIAGVAYWIMILVALSGIVGRYLYSSIPRRIDEAEMTMDEMSQLSADLGAQLEGQGIFTVEEMRPLFAMPPIEQVQAMPVWRALLTILSLDLRRTIQLIRLRWRHGSKRQDHAEFVRVLAVIKKRAALARSILFLSKMRKLFELWHVIHRPFSYSFAALVLLHVIVVMVLGFFWA
jgi:hypothetical protein